MKKLFKSSSGSAQLAAVIAAAAVGSVVMVTNAQMFSRFGSASKEVLQINVAQDVRRQLEVFLSEPANCAANFAGQAPNAHSNAGGNSGGAGNSGNSNAGGQGQTIGNGNPGGNSNGTNFTIRTTDFVAPGSNTTVVDVGATNTYDGGLMVLTGWGLQNTTTIIDPGPPTRMLVDVHLVFQKTGPNPGSPVIRTVKMVVQKTNDATSNISTCYAISGFNSDLWTRDNGGDNIYNNNTGNVGINTNAPAEKLDLNGAFLVTGSVSTANLSSTVNSAIGGDLFVTGGTAVGHNTPTERLHVMGNSVISGSLTATGALDTNNLTTVTNFNIGGGLSVTGQSTLNTINTTGHADFNNAATFNGNSSFQASARMPGTVGVGNYNPVAPNIFGVGGSASVTGSINDVVEGRAGSFCIGINCRTTFATQTAPANQVIRRLNVDGTVAYANPNCAADQLFKGLDANGNPICHDLPVNTCPAGQYLEAFNPATATPTCKPIPPEVQVPSCTGNQRVVRIQNGVATCADPVFASGSPCPFGQVAVEVTTSGAPVCASPIRGTPTSCPIGQVARGINSNGTPICGSPFSGGGCNAGEVAIGINANGSLNCVPVTHLVGGACGGGVAISVSASGVPSCGCPPADMTWSSSTSSCDATVPATPNGMSSTVFDNVGSSTGQATFSCSNGNWNVTPTSSSCDPVCPAGTSVGGAGGGAIPTSCSCNNAGETWDGSACVAGGTGGTGSCTPGPGICCVGYPMGWTTNTVEGSFTCLARFGPSAVSVGINSIDSDDCAVNSPCYGTLVYDCLADGTIDYRSWSCQSGQWP